MAYKGSDVKEVTINHPTVGSFSLFCKAGEGSNIDLGGIRKNDDKQGITGNGEIMVQQTQNRSSFELPPIAWDKSGKVLGKLVGLATSSDGSTVTVSYFDGYIVVMQNGHPVGDIVGDGYVGTIPLTFHGDANAKELV